MTDNRPRRSGRISVAVPILLIGSDSEGKVFSEQMHTVMLSLHGAGIVSRHKLVAEQQLVLREKATNREAEIRVVGEIGKQGRMYTYGVAFLEETQRFWLMDFPAGPAHEEQPAVLLLECGGCGEVMELANGDYEYDICAIQGGLAQYCKECGLLTVWSKTEKEMRAERRVTAGAKLKEAGLVTELAEMVEMGEPKRRTKKATAGAERKERRLATERAEQAAMTKPNDLLENVTALAEPGASEGEFFRVREDGCVWGRRGEVHRHVEGRGEFPERARLPEGDDGGDCGAVLGGGAGGADDLRAGENCECQGDG
jgi:hypothetical protein